MTVTSSAINYIQSTILLHQEFNMVLDFI